jgi:hypothetical protein
MQMMYKSNQNCHYEPTPPYNEYPNKKFIIKKSIKENILKM